MDKTEKQIKEYAETEKTEIKKREVSALFEESISIEITVNNPNFMHRLGIIPKKRMFKLKPASLGTLFAISKELLEIDSESLVDETKTVYSMSLRMIVKHKDRLLRIIAHAINNNPDPPSYWLIRYLDRNMSAAELLSIINVVIRQMDVTNFFYSIVIAGKMGMLSEKQPTLGVSSEGSLNTTDSDGTKSSGKEVGKT